MTKYVGKIYCRNSKGLVRKLPKKFLGDIFCCTMVQPSPAQSTVKGMNSIAVDFAVCA